MYLDNAVANYRGSAYPSYGNGWHSSSGDKTPPLSDASTADSRGVIQLENLQGDYASEYADSGYLMQQRDVYGQARMAAINHYMHAAYGQQTYEKQPPTSGGPSGYADARPRAAEALRLADYMQPAAGHPQVAFIQSPNGQPQAIMIPQFMPTPMPVPFQVPPGFMLVPDHSEPDQRPPQSSPMTKPSRDSSRGNSRNRPKQQRQSGDSGGKVSKIFVGGLSPASTVETLREHFSKFGEIVDVAVILEPTTRKSRGFGYVEFADGIPAGLLDIEHYVDSRRCGVRPYQYNPEDKA